VLHGTASFEVDAPDAAEIAQRIAGVQELGLPYVVAEIGGEIAGYAYGGRFRPRAAYRATAENSVYVAERFQRRGVARVLMQRVMDLCRGAGVREMIAMIGDPPAAAASIGLHRALGFREVGVLRGVGEKFGKAVDVLIMQKTLPRE
jgi:L-amino acid N-acyltransferase YncA